MEHLRAVRRHAARPRGPDRRGPRLVRPSLPALAGSTALMLGGALLYRRFRPGTER